MVNSLKVDPPRFVKVSVAKSVFAPLKHKDQPSHTRRSATRLLICVFGVCASFLLFGVIQEDLLTGELSLSPTFTLVTGCLSNAIVALVWQNAYLRLKSHRCSRHKHNSNSEKHSVLPLHHGLLLVTSACYVLGMVASNEAIRYVGYPVTVLVKSCKLVPTMLFGHFVEGRSYQVNDWLSVSFIAIGGLQMIRHSLIQSSAIDEDILHEDSIVGMGLLLASLVLDGILTSCLSALKNIDHDKYRFPSAAETMLLLNLYGLLFLVPFSLWTAQWSTGVEMLAQSAREDRSLVWDLLALNVVAGVGQMFVFLLASWFSPFVATIVTTTRKFFTIALSIAVYGHDFSSEQWTAVASVFGGLYLVSLGHHQRGGPN